MTDWLKPPSVPPEPAPDDDKVLRDEMSPPPAPGAAPSGQAAGPVSGDEGTESTSNAGDDDQANLLPEAPDGSDER